MKVGQSVMLSRGRPLGLSISVDGDKSPFAPAQGDTSIVRPQTNFSISCGMVTRAPAAGPPEQRTNPTKRHGSWTGYVR